MITTKTTNAGPVGLLPCGDYDPDRSYRFLETVLHDHDSWVCTYLLNGSPFDSQGEWLTIKGQQPSAGSAYWKALTDGGRAAAAAVTSCNAAAGTARSAASTAETAADNARTQANRAKAHADHPWELRSDGYIYVYDEATDTMVRTEKMILDAADLSSEQIALAIEKVTAEHLLGPSYDEDEEEIVFPVNSTTYYDPESEEVSIG